MAKPQSDKSPKTQSDSRGRLTVHLDTEWIRAVDFMATTRQSNLSDFILGLIQGHLASMPRSEAEAIRSLVKISTGKSLRLERSSGHTTAELAPEHPGQGTGDGLVERAESINRIRANALEKPVDSAIELAYSSTRFAD